MDNILLIREDALLGKTAIRDNQRQNNEHNGDNDEGEDLCSAALPGLFQANGRIYQGEKQ